MKKSLTALAGLGAMGYVGANHPEVYETIGNVVGATHGILEGTYNTAINILGSIPYAGTAAPFAFPSIAGASLGYKFGDYLSSGMTNKYGKNIIKLLGTITGGSLGYVASQSVLAPYLGIYGAYKGVTLGWKYGGKALKTLGRSVNKVSGAVLKPIIRTPKNIVNDIKDGWNKGLFSKAV